jgi:uncharacterized protein YicC (UPF0701 family)
MAADDTPTTKGTTAQEQDLSLRLRRQVSNAYAAVRGEQTAKDFAAYTFEEALDAQIERIEGEGTQLRPNLLDRVTRIETELVSAVEEIKAMPPESFIEPNPDEDVNTELEPV